MKIISTKNFTVSINGHNFVKLLVLKYLSQTLLSYLFFCFKFYIPQRHTRVLYIQVNRKVTQTRRNKIQEMTSNTNNFRNVNNTIVTQLADYGYFVYSIHRSFRLSSIYLVICLDRSA